MSKVIDGDIVKTINDIRLGHSLARAMSDNPQGPLIIHYGTSSEGQSFVKVKIGETVKTSIDESLSEATVKALAGLFNGG